MAMQRGRGQEQPPHHGIALDADGLPNVDDFIAVPELSSPEDDSRQLRRRSSSRPRVSADSASAAAGPNPYVNPNADRALLHSPPPARDARVASKSPEPAGRAVPAMMRSLASPLRRGRRSLSPNRRPTAAASGGAAAVAVEDPVTGELGCLSPVQGAGELTGTVGPFPSQAPTELDVTQLTDSPDYNPGSVLMNHLRGDPMSASPSQSEVPAYTEQDSRDWDYQRQMQFQRGGFMHDQVPPVPPPAGPPGFRPHQVPPLDFGQMRLGPPSDRFTDQASMNSLGFVPMPSNMPPLREDRGSRSPVPRGADFLRFQQMQQMQRQQQQMQFLQQQEQQQLSNASGSTSFFQGGAGHIPGQGLRPRQLRDPMAESFLPPAGPPPAAAGVMHRHPAGTAGPMGHPQAQEHSPLRRRYHHPEADGAAALPARTPGRRASVAETEFHSCGVGDATVAPRPAAEREGEARPSQASQAAGEPPRPPPPQSWGWGQPPAAHASTSQGLQRESSEGAGPRPAVPAPGAPIQSQGQMPQPAGQGMPMQGGAVPGVASMQPGPPAAVAQTAGRMAPPMTQVAVPPPPVAMGGVPPNFQSAPFRDPQGMMGFSQGVMGGAPQGMMPPMQPTQYGQRHNLYAPTFGWQTQGRMAAAVPPPPQASQYPGYGYGGWPSQAAAMPPMQAPAAPMQVPAAPMQVPAPPMQVPAPQVQPAQPAQPAPSVQQAQPAQTVQPPALHMPPHHPSAPPATQGPMSVPSVPAPSGPADGVAVAASAGAGSSAAPAAPSSVPAAPAATPNVAPGHPAPPLRTQGQMAPVSAAPVARDRADARPPSPRSPAGVAPRSPREGEAHIPDAYEGLDDQPIVSTPPATFEQGQQTTPEKSKMVLRRPRRAANAETPQPRRGPFELVQVGIDQFRSLNRNRERPRRHHIRVLEHWRNEQVVYERAPGSAMPTVAAVVVARPLQADAAGAADRRPAPVPLESSSPQAIYRDECSPKSDGDRSYSEQEISEDLDGLSPVKQRKKVTGRTPSHGRSRSRSRGYTAAATAAAAAAATKAAAKTLAAGGRGRSQSRGRQTPRQRAQSAQPVLHMASDESDFVGAENRSSSAPGALRKGRKASVTPPRINRKRKVANTDVSSEDLEFEPLEDGFCRVPPAEGSTYACEIRVGLDNGYWMCCDIKIPPRSFNTPEQMAENKSLMIHVLDSQKGALSADINGDVIQLNQGDSIVVRPLNEYCLRNTSVDAYARLKMVMITER
eukprot:TRINITY_DN6830_c0_g1_i1.p1 TRINITY_DN6830_c0_g1~~TRINITY_DN6830_c0_g1_i1.p1  ORF type:complete len:1243 (+),score=331.87 TRINITY_DN6830_c0_g1_i1:57-3785(+)